MKKLFFICFFWLGTYSFAQTLMSKNGERILPEAKDWGISLDATKFIKNANLDFVTNIQTISGKYFKDSVTAFRGGIRTGFGSWLATSWVPDRTKALTTSAFPATIPLKENKWTRSYTAIGLNFGIEKRRGKTRLQGVYGAEFGVFFLSLTDKFKYANQLNASSGTSGISVDSTFDAMSSPIFGKADNIDKSPAIQGVTGYARVVERNSGLTFSFLARVFIGAEYFVLPKLSLGGEFGWGPNVTIQARSKTIYESIGISTVPGTSSVPSVKQSTFDGSFNRGFFSDNDTGINFLGGASASVRINLYF